MSSEMRELIEDWRSGRLSGYVGLTKTERAVLRVCASELELRLARTEAGADGAEPFGWWIECHGTDGDFGQFVTDRAFVELLRSHGVVERETALFTRPQDASGDAEDAKRMDWLVANVTETLTVKSIRGEFPYPEHKTQYVLPRLTAWADFHGQVGFREAIDIAMQAKEAK